METKTIFLGTTVALLVALAATLGVLLTATPTTVSPGTSGKTDLTSSPLANTNLQTGKTSSAPAIGQSTTTDLNIISVSGTGTVGVQPDRAKIQMAIVTEAATAEKASAQNADNFNALLKALLAAGIPKDQIETIQYSIYPVYDYSQANRNPFITGYRATHLIVVTVIPTQSSDLGKATGTIIDTAVSAGVNQITTITFTVSDQKIKDLRNQALTAAVTDARSKADSMAKALGVTILGVHQASESSYTPVPVMYAGPADIAGKAASTELVPGEMKVTASVSIVYEIGQ
ncbi:MAG: SIMPL domain-containing protein [Thaumarchaeota archaeon]|nr:SIMPL domain-containing protein [Nitrososphaerota archaeon]MCL5316935.1 SIMPL domain-containing protein [Nitrososphaerota archaeon]